MQPGGCTGPSCEILHVQFTLMSIVDASIGASSAPLESDFFCMTCEPGLHYNDAPTPLHEQVSTQLTCKVASRFEKSCFDRVEDLPLPRSQTIIWLCIADDQIIMH